jgi:hypothetical protein
LAREILQVAGAPKVVGDHGVLQRRLPGNEAAAVAATLLRWLEVRVSQAGVVVSQDVVHHTLEGQAAPP